MASFWGSFESTKIHCGGLTPSDDVLGNTNHITRFREDLEMLYNAGVRELRYPAPWHRIEQTRGEYDFSWMDGPMEIMQRLGMIPCMDPLHHTSFPDWLTGGFENPEFPTRYFQFLQQFARRYEWVSRYTVFNEPLPTTVFCSLMGTWYPHAQCDTRFANMALAVGKTIALTSRWLKEQGKELIHIDSCEHHRAVDNNPDTKAWTEFANHRRFLFYDLVLGYIHRHHPLYPYLTKNGINPDNLRWFADNPGVIDVVGLDYYLHSEMPWYWDRHLGRANITEIPNHSFKPRGFAAVAFDYYTHLDKRPLILTETNIRGYHFERLTWLKLMLEQYEQLERRGLDMRGFCWFPSIDSTDWGGIDADGKPHTGCCTKSTKCVDPQGIWMLDCERWNRLPSELSEWYSKLAQGKTTSEAIPAYEELPEDIQNFGRFTKHWKWTPLPEAEELKLAA